MTSPSSVTTQLPVTTQIVCAPPHHMWPPSQASMPQHYMHHPYCSCHPSWPCHPHYLLHLHCPCHVSHPHQPYCLYYPLIPITDQYCHLFSAASTTITLLTTKIINENKIKTSHVTKTYLNKAHVHGLFDDIMIIVQAKCFGIHCFVEWPGVILKK